MMTKDGSGFGSGRISADFLVRGFRFQGLIFVHGFSGSGTRNIAGLERIFILTHGYPMKTRKIQPSAGLLAARWVA